MKQLALYTSIALLLTCTPAAFSQMAPGGSGVTGVPCNQLPALTGDVTSVAASCATSLRTWSTFTPSLTCGTATFTTNNARFLQANKLTVISLDFTITAIGTCTTFIGLAFTWPTTPNGSAAISGIESGPSGGGHQAVACVTSSSASTGTCTKNANVAFTTNERIYVGGVYENQ